MKGFPYERIVRFAFSGGLATAVHFSVMAILVCHEAGAVTATAVGAVCGAAANYFLQYYYTFRSVREHRATLIAYVIAGVIAWLSNLLVFAVLYQIFDMDMRVAQLVTTVVVALQNYFIYKKLVFHERAAREI